MLQDSLEKHSLPIDPVQTGVLNEYCRLLWEWNTRLNLTRHTDYDSFVGRDLLDTWHLAQQIDSGTEVMDIGSGGGVPGIPLGILRPDLRISMVESVKKKAAALEDIVRQLGLETPVYAERAEVVIAANPCSTVTARAVAPLPRLLTWFEPLRSHFDQLLLIKGPRWKDEYKTASEDGLTKTVSCSEICSWRTAGRDGDSVLLRVTFD